MAAKRYHWNLHIPSIYINELVLIAAQKNYLNKSKEITQMLAFIVIPFYLFLLRTKLILFIWSHNALKMSVQFIYMQCKLWFFKPMLVRLGLVRVNQLNGISIKFLVTDVVVAALFWLHALANRYSNIIFCVCVFVCAWAVFFLFFHFFIYYNIIQNLSSQSIQINVNG